jgi:hypothetical protein
MTDALEDVLRLVAEGRLTPQEAAPLIAALSGQAAEPSTRGTSETRTAYGPAGGGPAGPRPAGPGPAGGGPSRIRLEVRDRGRTVVDLQVPGILAGLASSLPGIPANYADRVREALRTGLRGPIMDIRDEDGGGVTITID